MNLFEKLQIIKQELLESNLKKSGKNKFAGFEYFELSDFLPTIIKLCNNHKVFTAVSFDKDNAKLIAINCEDSNEKIEVTSPMEELELKGCNKVQALGGVETYQRRYLYMSLFDITENDMFDGTQAVEKDKKYYCENCKTEITSLTKNGNTFTPKQLYELAKARTGQGLCPECVEKFKTKGEEK